LYCTAGFGGWDENTFAEPYVAAGAVKEVVAGHFNSMPAVMRMARENKIEAYNLPLGVMSHSLRAAAGRRGGFLSKVGLGIFVDPRLDGPGINDISKQELVKVVTLEGEEYLYYKTPKIDIAFIKGTTVDPNGNISFEREYLTIDALAMAQAAKNNGGKVIVQVDQVSHIFARPRNIIIPGILVDAVVVGEGQEMEHHRVYNPTLSGDIHVPPTHMDYWMGKLDPAGKRKKGIDEYSAEIIGERAAKELKQGDIVNIGIGLPEMVGKYASQMGVLKDITLTVEAGGIGGVPAPGACFGATIGPDMICDMANQFDFYDGGGLSICFMGAIEADCHGNVNAHRMGERFAGIGGFANITAAAKTVVFCMNFTTKGLNVVKENGKISIKQEGSIRKFKKEIRSISFSGKNAIARGQRVLYITERCVFTLTKDGLSLLEVYDGIDKKSCIIDLLDFELAE
jgi:propionate CoA-transferase